jgi:hypothetical protein
VREQLSLFRGITPIEIGDSVATRELIVLIVRDGGLRSALIARLSLQGESLVTLDADPEDPKVHRIAPAPRILVIDKAVLGERLATVVASNHWRGVIALSEDVEEAEAGDPLCIVPRGQALAGVTEALGRWRISRDE